MAYAKKPAMKAKEVAKKAVKKDKPAPFEPVKKMKMSKPAKKK